MDGPGARRKSGNRPRMKTALIFPSTHTLSHIGRALVLAEWLRAEGWSVHLGVAASRLEWTAGFWSQSHPVREIWESPNVPFPCFQWFSDADEIERCIRSQEALLRELDPDVVVGIFDYMSGISAASRPRISINSACMMPDYPGVLGFDEVDSPLRAKHRLRLERFWRSTARVFHPSQRARGQATCQLPVELMRGSENLVYEVPEIGSPGGQGIGEMIGPLFWQGWETIGERAPWSRDRSRKTIYVNAGTFSLDPRVLRNVIDRCLERGARVLLSGRQDAGRASTDERLCYRPFLAPSSAAELADLVVCTGGIGACYSNLRYGIPSLVVPMQPEQASNGIHLRQARCGLALTANLAYNGWPGEYADAFDPGEFAQALDSALERPGQFTGLAPLAAALRTCDTRAKFMAALGNVI